MLSIEITRSGETHQRLAGSRWSDQCQSEGHILVDGHDSSRDRLWTLRELVAFVLQDVIVLGHVLTADRILLLDHGELVAEGNHESLLVSSELYRLLATQLTR
jgi:ABC-type multidrug transport system fused ATPase/permease subunit